MDLESSSSQPRPLSETSDFSLSGSREESLRAKTSLRLNYEAQVEVIRRQIGGLEGARKKLGLSQRKISQLLLVDPSAWTRWIRDGEKAPPHIFRALQWYLSLQEKLPGLTPEYFTGPRAPALEGRLDLSRQNQSRLENRLASLEKAHHQMRRLNLGLGFLSLGLTIVLAIIVCKFALVN